MKDRKISTQLLKEVFGDLFNGKKKPEDEKPKRTPSVVRCEWEEDGEIYYCWKIDTGSNIMYTNDAGKAIFDKAVEDNLMSSGFISPEDKD